MVDVTDFYGAFLIYVHAWTNEDKDGGYNVTRIRILAITTLIKIKIVS